jgi:hypothetical protein
MNSAIIWVLSIHLSGAYCLGGVEIKFPTEQACESAKSGINMNDSRGISSAECSPRKQK